jgi:hypothetical protein
MPAELRLAFALLIAAVGGALGAIAASDFLQDGGADDLADVSGGAAGGMLLAAAAAWWLLGAGWDLLIGRPPLPG